jgi:hypothetical protein
MVKFFPQQNSSLSSHLRLETAFHGIWSDILKVLCFSPEPQPHRLVARALDSSPPPVPCQQTDIVFILDEITPRTLLVEFALISRMLLLINNSAGITDSWNGSARFDLLVFFFKKIVKLQVPRVSFITLTFFLIFVLNDKN